MNIADQQIERNWDDISLNGSAKELRSFQMGWIETRIGLEIMRCVIKNPVVKEMIGLIIRSGDMIYRKSQH